MSNRSVERQEKEPRGKIVIFQAARDGGVMVRIEGKVCFPDRGWKTRWLKDKEWEPQVGDEWRVEISGQNSTGKVGFLSPVVERMSTAQEREERAIAEQDKQREKVRLAKETVKRLGLPDYMATYPDDLETLIAKAKTTGEENSGWVVLQADGARGMNEETWKKYRESRRPVEQKIQQLGKGDATDEDAQAWVAGKLTATTEEIVSPWSGSKLATTVKYQNGHQATVVWEYDVFPENKLHKMAMGSGETAYQLLPESVRKEWEDFRARIAKKVEPHQNQIEDDASALVWAAGGDVPATEACRWGDVSFEDNSWLYNDPNVEEGIGAHDNTIWSGPSFNVAIRQARIKEARLDLPFRPDVAEAMRTSFNRLSEDKREPLDQAKVEEALAIVKSREEIAQMLERRRLPQPANGQEIEVADWYGVSVKVNSWQSVEMHGSRAQWQGGGSAIVEANGNSYDLYNPSGDFRELINVIREKTGQKEGPIIPPENEDEARRRLENFNRDQENLPKIEGIEWDTSYLGVRGYAASENKILLTAIPNIDGEPDEKGFFNTHTLILKGQGLPKEGVAVGKMGFREGRRQNGYLAELTGSPNTTIDWMIQEKELDPRKLTLEWQPINSKKPKK